MSAPLMVREARLPQGFPLPGPIGQVLVKHYPAYRAAIVQASAVQNADPNRMFRPLFNHINARGPPMTAPVELTYPMPDPATRPIAMAFLYRTTDTGTPGPDGAVEVRDVPAMTVVSVAVRGGYESGFRDGVEQLRQWLDDKRGRYEAAGRPRFLAYNSPFVPGFLKVGEAQIPVRPAQP